jgi:hypothetical protein
MPDVAALARRITAFPFMMISISIAARLSMRGPVTN